MGFSEKRRFVRHLCADIAVIPECSQRSIESPAGDEFEGVWFGTDANKGIGVLVAKPWRIVRFHEAQQKWVAPVWIDGPCGFLLVAVWTARIYENDKASYIAQACEAVEYHPEWFDGKPLVMCGDFNSNAIWDDNHKKNQSWLVDFLAKRNVVSAYHHFFSERQGEEKQPTLYFRRKENCRFHIDYMFLPKSWAERITNVEVGDYGTWGKVSDHVPLIVDVNLGEK